MRFAPNWKLTIFALIFLPLLLALGTWQLRRADEKRAVEAELRAGATADVQVLRADAEDAPPHLARVRVRGRLDTERLVFLDNRTHAGRVGYEIFARLEDAASDGAFLVGLGWLPAPPRRERLPEPRLPAAPVTIHGRLLKERSETPVFGPVSEGDAWPRRVQRIDPERLEAAFGARLYDWPVIAEAGEPGVQTHVFRALRMTPARHTAYATQWFGLAAVLLLGWIIASVRRQPPDDERRSDEGRET